MSAQKMNKWLLAAAFFAWLIPVVISIIALIQANKGAPDYYALPSALRYSFTESNLWSTDGPHKGILSVVIENLGKTPARDVRLIVSPISREPTITSDQNIDVQDAPFGGKVITVDRIPAQGVAVVDVIDSVEAFPLHGASGIDGKVFKYQYFPGIEDVQTEFGSVRCEYAMCMRQCLPAPDDGEGMPDAVVPPHVLKLAAELIKEVKNRSEAAPVK